MTMSAQHFAALRNAIEATADKQGTYFAASLSHERYRWDRLHASGFDLRPLWHAGLHDAYIDTGLRKIMGAEYTV